ncbi:beta strand repeat-containing protein, partial [Pontiella sp.]|uniref:beta strand repeat-containing protein n=1 Tax=Pontiella sp. TaxID=2837462 RepID=UPI0035693A8A
DLITDGGISTLSGNLGLSSGSHDFNILYNGLLLWPGAHCWLNADVSGLGSINKIGPGKLRIAGNNTYTGETTVLGGDIMIESNTALGSSVAGTTVNTGSRIYLSAFSSGSSKNIVGEALSLGGDFYSYGVANSWSGSIELTDDVEIKVSFGSSLELTGNIGGSGGVTKDWGGTLIYSGSSANSYSGDTVVNQGTLLLNRPANAIYYGSLTIGNGTGTDDSVIVRLQNDFQIWDSVDITINSDGWLDCDAYADTVGAITLEGGHAGSSTGTLRLGGDVTVIASDSEALLDGNVEMGSGTRTFTVGDGSVGYDLRATASLSGNGLLKTGGGLMALQGANTFTGAATVNQGRLYVLNDDALGTTAGGTTVSASGFIQLVGADVGAEPLTLARTSSGTVLYGTGSSSWAGDIVLDEDAQMAASGTLVLSGSISGAGGITMSSGGTISLSGSGNNTFDGDVTVVAGTLLMGKTGQSIPHSLLIGGNGTGDPVATARQLATSEIFEDVTINASGVYDLNGYNEAVRDLYLNGGADVDTGTATLTVVGDVLVDLLGIIDANSTMAGKLALSGNTTLEVPQGSASSGNPSDLIIDAVVSGSGNISKTGNGELQLTAANTFSGPFSVDAGALRLDNDLGLGTTAGGVSVNGSAYLQIHGGGHTVAGEHLTLNSTYGGWGALYSAGGPNVWTGDITLQSDAAIGVSSGAELTLSGSIGGGGDLHVVNTGTLVFGGSTANTYVGKTYVDSGTLALDKSVPNGTILGRLYIGDGSGGANADVLVLRSGGQIENERVTIADSGLFDLNGNLEYIGSLSGSGQVNLGSGTLSTGADGTSTTYSGLIQGSGIIRKYGWGTFTLSGNNTYSGDTEIYTGTLQVNGSQTASGVVVDVNGRLGGIGAVGAIESSGTVAPGTSAGMLGAGTTVLGTGSTFELELNGYTFPDYDRLEVKGDIKLADPDLDVSWGFVPAVGDSFLVIANDGNDAVAGSFSGLAEGASVVAGNVTLQITYTGGDGNDVVLAATDVQPLDDLVITSFDVAAGDADLEWEGGVPFYVVEKKTSLTNGTWTAVSSPTRDFAGTVPADTTNGFYRVTGGN